jgi:hypothetical protein
MVDIMFDLPSKKDVTKCIITKDTVLKKDIPIYIEDRKQHKEFDMKHFYSLFFSLLLLNASFAQNKLFINMDIAQTDHLKAYGITYHALEKGYKADWLLNFRGGSFMIDFSDDIALECRIAVLLLGTHPR